MNTCPNCGEELRFWDEAHFCPWPEIGRGGEGERGQR